MGLIFNMLYLQNPASLLWIVVDVAETAQQFSVFFSLIGQVPLLNVSKSLALLGPSHFSNFEVEHSLMSAESLNPAGERIIC